MVVSWDGVERRRQNTTLLRQLTERLSNLPPMIDDSQNYREYKPDGGTAFSWTLARIGNDILIQRWFITKGSIWNLHSHKGEEIIIIYQGAFELTIGDKIVTYNAGEYVCIPKDVVHSGLYLEDSKLVVITMFPIEEGYTNGK